MAIINLKDGFGFGQIEPNQTGFRTGNTEAQCAFDPEEFSSSVPASATDAAVVNIFAATEDGVHRDNSYGENGTFYAVDKIDVNDEIGTIKHVSAATEAAGYPIAINYSSEDIANQFTPGRKNFVQTTNEGGLPRLGYLRVGDRFTINNVELDTADYATATNATTARDAVKAAIASKQVIYATVQSAADTTTAGAGAHAGIVKLAAPADAATAKIPTDAVGGLVLRVVKAYTNADGSPAIMFQVIKANH